MQNSSDATINKIILNGQTLGLWKFSESHGKCLGFVQNTSNDGLEDVFFGGNGYRHILQSSVADLSPTKVNFKFYFQTFDENSLLFVAQDTSNPSAFIALNLKDGKIQLKVRHVDGSEVSLTSWKKYNNGNDTTVEVTMVYDRRNEKQTYSLEILMPQAAEPAIHKNKDLARAHVYKIKKSDIFIGGVSSAFKNGIPIDTTPFLGILKVTSEKLVVTNQNSFSHNIEPRHNNVSKF